MMNKGYHARDQPQAVPLQSLTILSSILHTIH